MPVVLVVTKSKPASCTLRLLRSLAGHAHLRLAVYAARRQTIVGSGHLNLNPETLATVDRELPRS